MESKHDLAQRQAAEWLTRRGGAVWSKEDEAALGQWMEASSANAVAFLRIEAAWKSADRFKALGAGFAPLSVPTPEELHASPFFDEVPNIRQISIEPPPPGLPRGRRKFLVASAAVVVAVFAAGVLWRVWAPQPVYRTPVGGLASVPMQDGSRVTLNTDSEIRIVVTDRERKVDLARGEAFFDVARDPRRPFVVDAGAQRVVVVGTQFSVRRDGDSVRVIVAEGKVKLEEGAARMTLVEQPAGTSPVYLEAGGVAQSSGRGVIVQSEPLPETQQALSWRSGFLLFKNAELSNAVAEFNRYNEKKMIIGDPEIAGLVFSGKFKATGVQAFVRLLTGGFPVVVDERPDAIYLNKKPTRN